MRTSNIHLALPPARIATNCCPLPTPLPVCSPLKGLALISSAQHRRLLSRFAGGHVKGKGPKGPLSASEFKDLHDHCAALIPSLGLVLQQVKAVKDK